MPLCSECDLPFTPNDFQRVCDSCGMQLERHYEELQEYRAHNLTMSELAGRVVWGERVEVERVWRVG
jgi:hypothetical protein